MLYSICMVNIWVRRNNQIGEMGSNPLDDDEWIRDNAEPQGEIVILDREMVRDNVVIRNDLNLQEQDVHVANANLQDEVDVPIANDPTLQVQNVRNDRKTAAVITFVVDNYSNTGEAFTIQGIYAAMQHLNEENRPSFSTVRNAIIGVMNDRDLTGFITRNQAIIPHQYWYRYRPGGLPEYRHP